MIKYFKILFLNEKFYRILVYIYLLIFFVSPQIKFLNLKLNIFDTGLYTSNLFSIYHLNNLEGLISGHFQPLLYLISNLFFFTDKYVINILLLIQSFVLISPIFIGKKENKIKLLYLISFPVWYINFNGFHIDTLVIPLLYLCLTTEKIYKYFFLLIIILIKEIYIILVIFFLIYESTYIQKKKIIYTIICILVILFIFIVYKLIEVEIFNSNLNYSFYEFQNYIKNLVVLENNSLPHIAKKLSIMSLIFIPYLFLNFKYKIFYLFYFPIFIIYFLLDNNNFLKPYFHYSAYLIALLFFIAKIEIFQSRKKVLAYIFFNILMTVNFLNPLFYSTNFELVKNYNFQNFINYNKYQKLDAFLSDINIPTKEPVTVSNNLLHYKIINRNHILVVGTNLHLTKSYSKCKKRNKVCEINSKYLILNLHDYFQNKDFIFNETSFKIIKENNEFIFIKK